MTNTFTGSPADDIQTQLRVIGPDGVLQGRNRERKNAFSQVSPDTP